MRDRWPVLVSEVMLHQTQVPRVAAAWPRFFGLFPSPDAMAEAGPGAGIQAGGTLRYPPPARPPLGAAAPIAAPGRPHDPPSPPRVRPDNAPAGAAPRRANPP